MRVHIARPEFKFSCAHMTVFPDGSKERLHGHNYTVSVAIEQPEGAPMLPFAAVKRALGDECLLLRERLLLPGDSPRFAAAARPDDPEADFEFRLCGARYVVPAGDTLVLPIDNVTVEGLASYLLARLGAALGPDLAAARASSFEVGVEESPGQGARARVAL